MGFYGFFALFYKCFYELLCEISFLASVRPQYDNSYLETYSSIAMEIASIAKASRRDEPVEQRRTTERTDERTDRQTVGRTDFRT